MKLTTHTMLSCCKCSDLGVTRSCSRREPPAGRWSRDHFDARMLSTAVKRTKHNRLKVVLTPKRHLMTQPGKAKRCGDQRRFRPWRLETSGNKDSLFICSDVGNWPTTCCLKYWDGSGVKLLHFTNEADAKASTETRYGTCSFPRSQFCKHPLQITCYGSVI